MVSQKLTANLVEDGESKEIEKPSRVRWWLAFMFFLIGLIAYMDRSNIAIIAKPMMEDLNMSKVQFGMLASVFSLGYALSQIPAGIIAERIGARKIVMIALIWWSVFTGLTAIVKSHGLLALVRFMFGVGGEGPMLFRATWSLIRIGLRNKKRSCCKRAVSGILFWSSDCTRDNRGYFSSMGMASRFLYLWSVGHIWLH